MTLPNLLIIGAQKCGTTWLHKALGKSERFWGSEKKEIMFWTRKSRDLEEYQTHFAGAPEDVAYIYESTPHYFRLPRHGNDTGAEIRNALGNIPLLLMLRDPAERYLSAYTHHMMKGRLPQVAVIDDLVEDHGMLRLGRYAEILDHYRALFSSIHVYLYDDLKTDAHGLIRKVFSDLDMTCDITPEMLAFRTNDKKRKMKRLNISELPVLSDNLRERLNEYYRDEVDRTAEMIGRDLSGWLRPPVKETAGGEAHISQPST
ncbi:sulfotransferase domain-containing protein [Paracoccus sediminicola]|uniref:sulfotransferase domain-containing protein n=1 Tax=Paracoccus sediminicola TaxID=3017783 RepID=UPI0022F0343E|nr:sulfotransferase domain-containing protein [Paracoccus sediminicola]WBU55864.1 sulfotransferase domain-containing protein [Paracoccus sediminicola]